MLPDKELVKFTPSKFKVIMGVVIDTEDHDCLEIHLPDDFDIYVETKAMEMTSQEAFSKKYVIPKKSLNTFKIDEKRNRNRNQIGEFSGERPKSNSKKHQLLSPKRPIYFDDIQDSRPKKQNTSKQDKVRELTPDRTFPKGSHVGRSLEKKSPSPNRPIYFEEPIQSSSPKKPKITKPVWLQNHVDKRHSVPTTSNQDKVRDSTPDKDKGFHLSRKRPICFEGAIEGSSPKKQNIVKNHVDKRHSFPSTSNQDKVRDSTSDKDKGFHLSRSLEKKRSGEQRKKRPERIEKSPDKQSRDIDILKVKITSPKKPKEAWITDIKDLEPKPAPEEPTIDSSSSSESSSEDEKKNNGMAQKSVEDNSSKLNERNGNAFLPENSPIRENENVSENEDVIDLTIPEKSPMVERPKNLPEVKYIGSTSSQNNQKSKNMARRSLRSNRKTVDLEFQISYPKCDVCGNQFYTENALTKHKLKKHSN